MTPSDSFRVRRLHPGEIEQMRELLACFSEAFGDPDTYVEAQPRDEYLHDLLSSEAFVALAAFVDDRVAGGLVAYQLRKFEQERSEFLIYDLAVAEPFRRRGIATALIEALKPIARSRSASVIFVQADRGDEAAIALYSKLGSREEVLNFDIPVD
jgi:aminoglycoside 3-N-acetyltransferase I